MQTIFQLFSVSDFGGKTRCARIDQNGAEFEFRPKIEEKNRNR
jgi:hypothetical protein